MTDGIAPSPRRALARWLFASDRRSVARRYLVLAGLMFVLGGAGALLLRAELAIPGLQYFEPGAFQRLVTMHATLMLYGAMLPAWLGLAIWRLPLVVGARETAFPGLSNLAFWLLVLGIALVLWQAMNAPVDGSGPIGPGASRSAVTAGRLLVLGAIALPLAVAGGNIAATVLGKRAPGVALAGIPPFAWASVFASVMLLAGAGGWLLALLPSDNGAPGAVGDSRLFWRFSHPFVYAMILPAMGVVSEIAAASAKRPLFAGSSSVYAMASLGILSLLVWARYAFVAPPLASHLLLMYVMMLMAVPAGVIVFNWLATVCKGTITLDAPTLFALAFVALFAVGGCAGFVLSIPVLGTRYHGSQFVTGHLHYLLFGGVAFALFAAVYFWLPALSGRRYEEPMAKAHFWLSLVGMNVAFLPHLLLGEAGMTRRAPDYPLAWMDLNAIASVGAILLGLAQLVFVYVVVKAVAVGPRTPRQELV